MAFQWAEVEIVIVDLDKKAQGKNVTDGWEHFGINDWPRAVQVKDRNRIADFTGESQDKIGRFSVNPMTSSDCMVQYQSVNNTWKNLVGGLYDTTSENLGNLLGILQRHKLIF